MRTNANESVQETSAKEFKEYDKAVAKSCKMDTFQDITAEAANDTSPITATNEDYVEVIKARSCWSSKRRERMPSP